MLDGRTLWELVEKRVAQTPDASFAIDEDDRALTFAEYKSAVERAAAGLQGLGVGGGTPVSWVLPTWVESLVLIGALSRLQAVQNPIIPIYREREIRFVTKQTGARLLVVPGTWRDFDYEQMAKSIAAGQEGLQVLVVDRHLPEGDPAQLPPPPTPLPADELPVRWVFYSSGTTADPKGAKHTDATIRAAAVGMIQALELAPDDLGPLAFPVTHIAGPVWLLSGLMIGFPQLLVEQFNPATTIPFMVRHDVTLPGSGTAFHLAYLAAQRAQPDKKLFPRARAFPGGGAPKPPQLHYDIKNEMGGVGIVSGYGLTEAPILTMANIHDPDDKLANTEGRVTPGVEIRVVTVEGKLAGPSEEGEIRVTGPQVCRGYVDPALTAEGFDEEDFFRTGDLGFVDAEGYVVITGRLKDVIIRKGENISAKEVEDLLYQHPKVGDVAVIGLPDPKSGERCCAVVAPKDKNDPLSFEEMAAFLKDQQLMVQKIPEQLEIVDELPRNPTGKILKHKLREHYATAK
jgi:cyclohexanecarboxylate-CoA ligase